MNEREIIFSEPWEEARNSERQYNNLELIKNRWLQTKHDAEESLKTPHTEEDINRLKEIIRVSDEILSVANEKQKSELKDITKLLRKHEQYREMLEKFNPKPEDYE